MNRRQQIRKIVEEKALMEAAESPLMTRQRPTILSAKGLARTLNREVEVLQSGVLPVSGLRKSMIQVWGSDRGKLIGDDGNNVTLVLKNSGRVIVPKTDFSKFFRVVPEEELVFSDPDKFETIY